MKITCEVIKDLLPLYHDGVCSDDSKRMIEEHITECSECKKNLEGMDSEIYIQTHIEENMEDAKVMKKISRKWRKENFISLLKGIGITLILLLILYCFMDIKVIQK